MLQSSNQPVEAFVDPNQPFDIRAFGIAFAIVAGLAAALILGCGIVAKPIGSWLRPRWEFPRQPWTGGFIFMAFCGFYALASAAGFLVVQWGWYTSDDKTETNTLSGLVARLAVTPPFLIALIAVLSQTLEPFRTPRLRRVASWIALGASSWFLIAAATTGIHILTISVKQELGGPVDQHPLTRLHPEQDRFGGALFAISVCVVTPWMEEFFFRGLLLPWVMRARYRPWLLVGWAFGFAFLAVGGIYGQHYWAIVFLAIGAVVLGLATRLPSVYPKRTILGIVSTSLLFAAVHSSVWPSPIPLFVLGLGLGYLTARTGSIVPAVVVHGLFNAVSFVYLLRLPT